MQEQGYKKRNRIERNWVVENDGERQGEVTAVVRRYGRGTSAWNVETSDCYRWANQCLDNH